MDADKHRSDGEDGSANARFSTKTHSLSSDVLVLCHGGPIAKPKDAQYMFEYCRGLDGFYGASSMERLAEMKKFTQLKLGKN